MIDTCEAIKITEKRIGSIKNQGEMDYYLNVLQALRYKAKEEKVSLVTGIDEFGYKTIDIVPMEKCDTFHGRMIHHISDIARRFGNRYANHVSEFFYGPEDLGCLPCYHRAEYIVHGWLCGLGMFAIGLVVFGLVRML